MKFRRCLTPLLRCGFLPPSLKPVNPFRHDLKTPTAQSIQLWLRENRPEIAARMSGNSGHVFSLAAVAAEMGLREHDAKSHEEMMQHSETYARQKTANRRLTGRLRCCVTWTAKPWSLQQHVG